MDARQKLLTAAVDHVAANGVRDTSLRRIADALGTSHRMLIYHFGSKDGLFVAVVQEMEHRQRAVIAGVLAELEIDGDGGTSGADTTSEVTRRTWRGLADPALWPHERLFFELYGRALQGDPHAGPLLEGIVTEHLDPLTEWGVRQGLPRSEARARARLGLAVFRGLLLDLLATGDRPGVDEAMERFIAMLRDA